jgi:hypothetical protein
MSKIDVIKSMFIRLMAIMLARTLGLKRASKVAEVLGIWSSLGTGSLIEFGCLRFFTGKFRNEIWIEII